MQTPDKVNDWVLALVCGQLRTFRGAPLTARTVRAMMETIIETTGYRNDMDPAETISPDAIGRMMGQALKLETLREKERADAEPQPADHG